MAHNVICPQKNIIPRILKISGTLIVIKYLYYWFCHDCACFAAKSNQHIFAKDEKKSVLAILIRTRLVPLKRVGIRFKFLHIALSKNQQKCSPQRKRNDAIRTKHSVSLPPIFKSR
jgi:hypothetical protein